MLAPPSCLEEVSKSGFMAVIDLSFIKLVVNLCLYQIFFPRHIIITQKTSCKVVLFHERRNVRQQSNSF